MIFLFCSIRCFRSKYLSNFTDIQLNGDANAEKKEDQQPKVTIELKIKDVYNGTLNKIPAYEELKKKYELDDSSIAYLGDDWIDIPVMNRVAVPIAVENASLEVKNIAIHITKTSGGNGAFREAVEWIIDQQGRKEEIIEMMQKRLLDS